MAVREAQPSSVVTAFFDDTTGTVSYLVADPLSRRAAIIDSVLDFDAAAGRTSTRSADMILDHVRENDFSVDWHLETHVHADHLTAAVYLKGKLGGRIAIGEHVRMVQSVFRDVFNAEDEFVADGQQFDHLFKNGERFRIGTLEAQVIHTPGHTPACVTYLIGATAFVGDTLFMPDYGTARCDFPGGEAQTLYRSIQQIFQLPAETVLYMCHDYRPGGRPAMWQTTVAKERAENVHIHDGISEDAFVNMRKARDKTLAMPVLLLPAVQVNMRAGHLPPAEKNGIHYLKIPLNGF
jgi:glyoxylase-like metal-dependent hydrolase (beta-lactamase superfamily II)